MDTPRRRPKSPPSKPPTLVQVAEARSYDSSRLEAKARGNLASKTERPRAFLGTSASIGGSIHTHCWAAEVMPR